MPQQRQQLLLHHLPQRLALLLLACGRESGSSCKCGRQRLAIHVGRVLLQDARQLPRARAVLRPQRARHAFVILPRIAAAELLLLQLLRLLWLWRL